MCNCISKMDELLADKNIRIARGFQMSAGSLELSPPFVTTEKINKKLRKAPPSVIASFCPFCGDKYNN